MKILLIGLLALTSVAQANQPLFDAVKSRDVNAVRSTLSHDPKVEINFVPIGSVYTPLILAAQNGDLEIVDLLLAHGAAVNFQPVTSSYSDCCIYDSNKRYEATALMKAVSVGNERIATELLNHRADPNLQIINSYPEIDVTNPWDPIQYQDKYFESPLTLAVKSNNLKMVKLLLSYKADQNLKDNDIVAVDYSSEQKSNDITRVLLKSGADLSLSSFSYFLTCDEELVQDFIDAGIGLKKDKNSNSALELLVEALDQDLTARFKLLIQSGTDLNSALMALARIEEYAALPPEQKVRFKHYTEMLLASNPDLDRKDGYDQTALLLSLIHFNNPEMAKALILAGANPNIRDNEGWTAHKLIRHFSHIWSNSDRATRKQARALLRLIRKPKH